MKFSQTHLGTTVWVLPLHAGCAVDFMDLVVLLLLPAIFVRHHPDWTVPSGRWATVGFIAGAEGRLLVDIIANGNYNLPAAPTAESTVAQ